MEYHSRPKARRARIAWDYFMDKHKWMKNTTRELTMGYSPNLDYYGPGWYMTVSHTDRDTLHWHGHEDICFKVFSSALS